MFGKRQNRGLDPLKNAQRITEWELETLLNLVKKEIEYAGRHASGGAPTYTFRLSVLGDKLFNLKKVYESWR